MDPVPRKKIAGHCPAYYLWFLSSSNDLDFCAYLNEAARSLARQESSRDLDHRIGYAATVISDPRGGNLDEVGMLVIHYAKEP
jgi:hypothetical protein